MSGCPRDTNGDGDCGRVACPHCGPYAKDYERLLRNEDEMRRSLLGIRDRAAKASPGPWTLETDSDDREFATNPPFPFAIHGPVNECYAERPEADPFRTQVSEVSDLSMEDAEFLVHAREDIPRLLAAADALLMLVTLKDGPRDERYEADKPKAWQAAREALDALTPKIDPLPDPDVFAIEVARIRAALTQPSTVANGHWEGSNWIESGCTTCAAGNAATFHRHTTTEPT